MSAKMSAKPWLAVALKLIVTLSLLGALFAITDVEQFIASLARLPLWFIPLAWAIYSCCYLLSAYRWQVLLAAKGIGVPLRKLFSFYLVGMFMNNFLPGSVGGDVVKAYDLYRHTGAGTHSVASVFMDRFTGLVGLAVLGVCTALMFDTGAAAPLVAWTVFGAAGFLAAVTFALWYAPVATRVLRLVRVCCPRSLHDKIQALYDAIDSYRQDVQTVLWTIALSLVLHTAIASYYATTAAVMDLPIDLRYFLLFLPAITLVTLVPISIGGLGLREGMMIALFTQTGIASADVLAVSLTVHVVNMMLSLWGGAILLFRRAHPASAET